MPILRACINQRKSQGVSDGSGENQKSPTGPFRGAGAYWFSYRPGDDGRTLATISIGCSKSEVYHSWPYSLPKRSEASSVGLIQQSSRADSGRFVSVVRCVLNGRK